MTGADVRHRFPGVRDGWARFDGPAGTQMVDVAIRAASEWSASGNNANTHGTFAAANATDDLLERARGVVAQLLDADPQSVVFGANMTTLTFAFTRAVARTLQPGDRVVGTRLDHDANVSPWRIACEESGAEHVLAPFPLLMADWIRMRSQRSSPPTPSGWQSLGLRTSSARCQM